MIKVIVIDVKRKGKISQIKQPCLSDRKELFKVYQEMIQFQKMSHLQNQNQNDN